MFRFVCVPFPFFSLLSIFRIYELRFLRDCALIERAVRKCWSVSLASLDFPVYIGLFCLFHYLLLSTQYDDISICIFQREQQRLWTQSNENGLEWIYSYTWLDACRDVCVCQSTHLYLNLIYTKTRKWTTNVSFYLWIMIK